MWQIGNIRIDRVVEFQMPLLAPSVLLPDTSPAAMDRHRHWLEPELMDPQTGFLVIAFHSFVIRSKNCVILVDTCSGNDRQRPQKPRYHLKHWPYLENLAAAHVTPDEITHVLCTHLHVDHVGWNTRLVDGKWVPTFPNAKYLFSRVEYEFWSQQFTTGAFKGDPYYLDCIAPIFDAGLSSLVEMDVELDEGVRLIPSPGHTPGHVCVLISSAGQNAIMSGDIMHHPLQCAEPQWNSCFCVDQDLARKTRKEFLNQYADTDTLVMPAHFPTPSVGKIIPWDSGFHFTAYPRDQAKG
jgi:glyoxylase-like metal-dependent hydrolase (beta-lactamase superfamily II)